MHPSLCADEEERLLALYRYQVLETPPEDELDELARLAARICDTPIACIHFVAEEHPWSKSTLGTGGLLEVSLARSFCAHAIREPGTLVVADTHNDPRFAQSPQVTGAPHVRFYAGAPLRSPEGYCLGTLCVLDTVPRQLNDDQQQTLEFLARQVMAQIELKRQMDQVRRLNESVQRTIEESHHRIKNNLQVLAALVDVQRLKHTNQVPIGELERISTHIRALGVLHELLTTNAEPGAETISLHHSLEKLVPLLQTASGERCIRIDSDRRLSLSVRRAGTLLPLISELVSNAIKHGQGEIEIGLHATLDNRITLTVTDEGTGFPPHFDVLSAANTGLDLIENMVRWDLQGDIQYTNTARGGACVVATFPYQPLDPMPA